MKLVIRTFAKRLVLLAADLFLVAITLPLALFLRLEQEYFSTYFPLLNLSYYSTALACYLISFLIFKPYRTILRLANLFTALRVAVAVVAGSVLFFSVAQFFQLAPIPRSVYIIQILLLVPACLMTRFSLRIVDRVLHFQPSTGVRTLIYGAGLTTDRILPMILKVRDQYNVLGIIDDDAGKRGSDVQGIRVLGSGKDVERLVEKLGITHVILSMPSLQGDKVRQIVKKLYNLELSVKILPSPQAYIDDSNLSTLTVRDIDIEDLLRRSPRKLDKGAIANLVQNKSVVVTGAGGSIGSELARQIASFSPNQLILNDTSEYGLYTITEELAAKYPNLKLVPYLANMTDENLCAALFEQNRIEIVFHACAYKHVPMLEENIISGVRNNLESADNVFGCARRSGVDKVILISSDKAVRPTNVMGATKRACELLALWHSQQIDNQTSFNCVRFGNVLGSSGSVLPKFMEQVRKGGPITITHPDITRYFMLIPEAVSLVLQAATAEGRFGTYLLNMGEPIRIVDMAKDLLQLMGKQFDKDIKIVFTGLRPGEKLHEELNLECEELMPISEDFSKIVNQAVLKEDFRERITRLKEQCLAGNKNNVKQELFKIIRTYEIDNSLPLPPQKHTEVANDLEGSLEPINLVPNAQRTSSPENLTGAVTI